MSTLIDSHRGEKKEARPWTHGHCFAAHKPREVPTKAIHTSWSCTPCHTRIHQSLTPFAVSTGASSSRANLATHSQCLLQSRTTGDVRGGRGKAMWKDPSSYRSQPNSIGHIECVTPTHFLYIIYREADKYLITLWFWKFSHLEILLKSAHV